MTRIIEIVEHQTNWLKAFALEATHLREVFGARAVAIEHIGSTAVPGLMAKPVIDTLVILDTTDDIERFSAGMEALGYRVRGECLDAAIPGTPGRYYFSKNAGDVRTHQLHVCRANHPQIADLLAFRDYLRAHASVARAYEAVKSAAANEHRHEITGYMRHKASFMTETIRAAREWAEGVRS